MTGFAHSSGDLGFDPEAIRLKYLEESEKRRPAERTPSPPVASSVSVEDPFANPGFDRAPLFDEVVVVVGGLTGLITGMHLQEAGVPRVRLIDKAAGFSGLWYWNRDPGIRCALDAYVYVPRLEEVGTMPSEKFARGKEIRAHCLAFAQRFGLDEAACPADAGRIADGVRARRAVGVTAGFPRTARPGGVFRLDGRRSSRYATPLHASGRG